MSKLRETSGYGGALIAALLLLSGCQNDGGRQSSFGGIYLPPRDSQGLELRAFLSQDTIAPREPVELVYFIVNGPTPIPFLNHPDVFDVSVENTDGTLADIRQSRAVDGYFLGPNVHMDLPGNAVYGWRTDLRCITARTHVGGDSVGGCDLEFRLDQPGVYNVIVRYSPPVESRFAHPEISDTARLVIK